MMRRLVPPALRHRAHIAVAVAAAAVFAATACNGAADHADAPHLVLIDSVRLEEVDSTLVAKPNAVAVRGDGAVFISDIGEQRVLYANRDGRGLVVVARKGNGPGEVTSPSSLTVVGDTLLVVQSTGVRHHLFDARSRRYLETVKLSRRTGSFGSDHDSLLMGALRPETGTAFVVAGAGDTASRAGGTLPAIYRELPPLAQAFLGTALARDAHGVTGIMEASNTLYRWGAGTTDSIVLSTTVRRGARPDLMRELLRDPTKAPSLVFQWSVPFNTGTLSGNRSAVVFYEPTLVGQDFKGPFYIQLANWAQHRSCPEVRLPVPDDTPTRFAFVGDTLVALVQHVGDAGNGTWIIRMGVDGCR